MWVDLDLGVLDTQFDHSLALIEEVGDHPYFQRYHLVVGLAMDALIEGVGRDSMPLEPSWGIGNCLHSLCCLVVEVVLLRLCNRRSKHFSVARKLVEHLQAQVIGRHPVVLLPYY
mgnify:CR=1 FL=1